MEASFTIRFPTLALPNEQENPASKDQTRTVSEPTDEVILVQVGEGSREALAILFRRFARLVFTVASRILRNRSEADDLLQDVFLYIRKSATSFDPERSTARSWIVQIAYHRAFDRRRYLQSRHFYSQVELEGASEFPDKCAERQPEKEWVDQLVGNTTVTGLLASLSEDQRNTLGLYFYEGYTFEEIAAKLQQSVGNIRNHYYRGLEKLRKQIFPGKLPGRNGYGRK